MKRYEADGSETVHHCSLAFSNTPRDAIPAALILDENLITQNLMRLNLAFCMSIDRTDLGDRRFLLEDISPGLLPPELLQASMVK